MSRSGYFYDFEPLLHGRWRGQVASTIRGKRGQAFLREMLAALDALPQKRLISDHLEMSVDGDVCAIGAVGRARDFDMSTIDPDDSYQVAGAFGITRVLACEIAEVNDWDLETSEARYARVREWVVRHIDMEAQDGPR